MSGGPVGAVLAWTAANADAVRRSQASPIGASIWMTPCRLGAIFEQTWRRTPMVGGQLGRLLHRSARTGCHAGDATLLPRTPDPHGRQRGDRIEISFLLRRMVPHMLLWTISPPARECYECACLQSNRHRSTLAAGVSTNQRASKSHADFERPALIYPAAARCDPPIAVTHIEIRPRMFEMGRTIELVCGRHAWAPSPLRRLSMDVFHKFADLADCKIFNVYIERRLISESWTPFTRRKSVNRRPKRLTLAHAHTLGATVTSLMRFTMAAPGQHQSARCSEPREPGHLCSLYPKRKRISCLRYRPNAWN
jgi:hypothetical protein